MIPSRLSGNGKAMNRLHHLASRPWVMLTAAVGFLGAHLILFYVLRRSYSSHVALPGAVVVGAALLIIAKHPGLLAALLRPLRSFLRSRSQG